MEWRRILGKQLKDMYANRVVAERHETGEDEEMKTTKITKTMLAALFAVVVSVAMSACGGSGAPAADTGSDDAAGSAAGEMVLVSEGKLTVASDLDFPPLDSFEDGKPQGFDVDLSTEIAKRLGLEVEYLPPQNFDTIIPMIVQGGKADIGNSAFSITEERKQEIDFTSAYLDSNLGVAVKTGTDAATEEALNAEGKKIAVQSGTTGEDWARENLPNAEIVPLNTVTECMTGLSTDLYDAVCADLPVVGHQCTVSFTDCEIAFEIPTGEQYGIVVSKDNPALTAAIDEALAEMESDGTMDELKAKWFGDSM